MPRRPHKITERTTCQNISTPSDGIIQVALPTNHYHGAEVVGIPLENDGPDIDALEAALRKRVPKIFYVIADFQNPAGATCSNAKRQQIAELSRRYNFLVLEDAPYRMTISLRWNVNQNVSAQSEVSSDQSECGKR